mmetsp:Transcript_41483/g.133896  ORF Transcript_41483/g.133896 Transcript_41483/m.133896 type:complete len:221 (-) Transcript_41483:1442-2104(-)
MASRSGALRQHQQHRRRRNHRQESVFDESGGGWAPEEGAPSVKCAWETSKGMSRRSTKSAACRASLPWQSLICRPPKCTERTMRRLRTNRRLMNTGVGTAKSSWVGQCGSPRNGSSAAPSSSLHALALRNKLQTRSSRRSWLQTAGDDEKAGDIRSARPRAQCASRKQLSASKQASTLRTSKDTSSTCKCAAFPALGSMSRHRMCSEMKGASRASVCFPK